MTAKSIDWEHLSRQGHYRAHDMARFLYPEDSARKTFNRGKFLLRSLLYRAQLNRVFELFQSAPLRALPARHPELLDKPMRPDRFACSTVNQRVKMVEDHYRLLLGLYPELIDPLYLGEGIVLGHYPDGGWRIVLRHDGTFRREAELALSDQRAGEAHAQLCLLPAGSEAGAGPGDRVGAGAGALCQQPQEQVRH